MIGRGTDRDEQVGASGYVERLAVRSYGEGERLMSDWNGCSPRVGGHPDRGHGIATRVEDVERPAIGRDRHVEGLVAHWDCGTGRVGGCADGRHGVVALVGDVSRFAIRGDDDGDGSIAYPIYPVSFPMGSVTLHPADFETIRLSTVWPQ